MVSVPPFLLRRLYVSGSLRNTDDGFRFELRNTLAAGYAHKVHPITVDGAELPADSVTFELEGGTIALSDVSERRTLTLAVNRSVVVRARGARLAAGARTVGMAFDVPGLGTLRFDFTDSVGER